MFLPSRVAQLVEQPCAAGVGGFRPRHHILNNLRVTKNISF
jgi:hypothetical protein